MSDSALLLEKKIAGDLRKAQNNMFSGKNDDAWGIIEAVSSDIEQLKNINPNSRSITSFEQQFNRLRQDLEKKLKKGAGSAQPTFTAPTPPQTSSTPVTAQPSTQLKPSSEAKLPGGVTKRLEEMEKRLQQAEDSLNQAESRTSIDKARHHLEYVRGSYEELERMYKEHTNHPDILTLKGKLSALTSKIDVIQDKIESGAASAEENKSRVESRSKDWVEKIQPYLQGGAREKQLELSRIRGKQSLINQKNLLNEAKNLLKEFESSDWSIGKTEELEKAEKDLKHRIDEGQTAFEQSIKSVLGDAGSIIDEKLAQFKKDSAWRRDASLRPNWLVRGDRQSIDEKMGLVDELVPEIIPQNNPELLDLKNRLTELEEENRERLAELPKRTFMAPSKYSGADADTLREKAAQLVKDIAPEATILKVHLIREDWRMEDVVEHTDTSRTAIHRRVTYHIPAQVAACVGDKVQLYNAHVAKNQCPDGSFDHLYGNLEEYPQEIAPENLPK